MQKPILLFFTILIFTSAKAVEVIRINQLGYLPNSVKVAVFLSSEENRISTFTVHDSFSDEVIFTGKTEPKDAGDWGMKTAYRLNFSKLVSEGGYYIKVGKTRSPNIRINADVYNGTADFILNYMRQQRCGYNPFLKDSCHTHDGIIVDHPTKSGEFINVVGGWHDATDYLQYSTTSVNAVFQMMFAYNSFPEVYGDDYDANGDMRKKRNSRYSRRNKMGTRLDVKNEPGAKRNVQPNCRRPRSRWFSLACERHCQLWFGKISSGIFCNR